MAAPVKKLLAVSWAMPPMLFPRSIQVSRVLSELRRLAWDITVICSDPSQSTNVDLSLGGMYANHYQTIQVPMSNPNIPNDALMSNWLEPALRMVKHQLATQKYSALITFAQPWVDHLIGLEARRANIPWIAHFSDPWVDSPYYAGFEAEELRRWQKKEREVIQYADMILFTNAQALELVMGKYPINWRSKTRVIPHAFDDNISCDVDTKKTYTSRLKLLYTGDLYKGRSAEGLLKAFALLSKTRPLAEEIEVKLIGRIDPNEMQISNWLGLQNVVEFVDQLPYAQSLQMCAQSDVLLLIDAPTSIPSPFLPSKLVDYLAFRKPIFALTADEGASADLLHQLGFSTVPPDDVISISAALNTLLDTWQSGDLSIPPQYEQVAVMYNAHHVGAQLDRALQDAISRHPRRLWWQPWRN